MCVCGGIRRWGTSYVDECSSSSVSFSFSFFLGELVCASNEYDCVLM